MRRREQVGLRLLRPPRAAFAHERALLRCQPPGRRTLAYDSARRRLAARRQPLALLPGRTRAGRRAAARSEPRARRGAAARPYPALHATPRAVVHCVRHQHEPPQRCSCRLIACKQESARRLVAAPPPRPLARPAVLVTEPPSPPRATSAGNGLGVRSSSRRGSRQIREPSRLSWPQRPTTVGSLAVCERVGVQRAIGRPSGLPILTRSPSWMVYRRSFYAPLSVSCAFVRVQRASARTPPGVRAGIPLSARWPRLPL